MRVSLKLRYRSLEMLLATFLLDQACKGVPCWKSGKSFPFSRMELKAEGQLKTRSARAKICKALSIMMCAHIDNGRKQAQSDFHGVQCIMKVD